MDDTKTPLPASYETVMLDTLIRIRKEAGLTQAALGHCLGKPQPRISTREHGRTPITDAEKAQWVEACGVTMSDFLRRVREDLNMDEAEETDATQDEAQDEAGDNANT